MKSGCSLCGACVARLVETTLSLLILLMTSQLRQYALMRMDPRLQSINSLYEPSAARTAYLSDGAARSGLSMQTQSSDWNVVVTRTWPS